MSKPRAEARRNGAGVPDLAVHAEELASRLVGGMNRLAAQAQRGALRVKHAAQDLRVSPIVQHAIAARERGNLEAAFWLLNEEFTRRPDDVGVALHYWDVALSLGRVEIASTAGVRLIESHAAAGEPELAAQHWIELIRDAPAVLVAPAAIAMILPALKARLAETEDDGTDDREVLAGHLRRAVRHAVDPRNSGLHPGVALRIFEEGREINPEAARRAAEAALESPNLHEAKRERLLEWLGGKHVAAPSGGSGPAPGPAAAPDPTQVPVSTPMPGATPVPVSARATVSRAAPRTADAPESAGLSAAEIEQAAARLERSRRPAARPQTGKPEQAEKPKQTEKPREPERAQERRTDAPRTAEPKPAEPAAAAATVPEPALATGPRVTSATLTGLDDDGLVVVGDRNGRVRYDEIEAVSVAEILGLEDRSVTVIDLILNWALRHEERLEILRLRVDALDLGALVPRKHTLGSDFVALMSDIMERTRAIPLPDPESALGTRISCFASPELYESIALRTGTKPTA